MKKLTVSVELDFHELKSISYNLENVGHRPDHSSVEGKILQKLGQHVEHARILDDANAANKRVKELQEQRILIQKVIDEAIEKLRKHEGLILRAKLEADAAVRAVDALCEVKS